MAISRTSQSLRSVEKSRSLPRRPRSASRSARCATSTSVTTRFSSRTPGPRSTTPSTRRPSSPTLRLTTPSPRPFLRATWRGEFGGGDVGLRSHWARVYVSVLTNGHRHAVAMASVLGHYHVMLTGLYERLRGEDPTKEKAARNELIQWVSPGPLQVQFVR